MLSEADPRPPVFDVVGRPTPRGVGGVGAQDDLDSASVRRARSQLADLFATAGSPHRLPAHLGAECFVDLRGLQPLLESAADVRRCGGALAVVAPPHCLLKMIPFFALEEELPMADTVRRAAWWARTGAEV